MRLLVRLFAVVVIKYLLLIRENLPLCVLLANDRYCLPYQTGLQTISSNRCRNTIRIITNVGVENSIHSILSNVVKYLLSQEVTFLLKFTKLFTWQRIYVWEHSNKLMDKQENNCKLYNKKWTNF